MRTHWILFATVGLLFLPAQVSADEPPHECGWLFADYASGDTLLEVPQGFGVAVRGEFSGGWNCPQDHDWGLRVLVTDSQGQEHPGQVSFRGDTWRPSAFVWTPDREMEAGVVHTMHIEHDYTYPDPRNPPEMHSSTLQFTFVDAPIELPDASVEIWAGVELAVSGCCADRASDGTCGDSNCELTSTARIVAVIDAVPEGIAPYVGWRLSYASDGPAYQVAQGDAGTEAITIERTLEGAHLFAPHTTGLEVFVHGDSESTVLFSDYHQSAAMGDECRYVDIPDCEDEEPDPDLPHVEDTDPAGPDDPLDAAPQDDESIFDNGDQQARGRGTSGCTAAGRPAIWNLLFRR